MKRETRRAIRDLSYYSSLGLQVALSIFIGLFIGVKADSHFGTAPVLMFIFLGLGIAAGFRNIMLAKQKAERADKEDRE